MRLINHARLIPQSPTTYTVVWSLPSADGRRLEVRCRLQARSMQNPFAPNFFAQLSCPDRVTQLPNAYASADPSLRR